MLQYTTSYYIILYDYNHINFQDGPREDSRAARGLALLGGTYHCYYDYHCYHY